MINHRSITGIDVGITTGICTVIFDLEGLVEVSYTTMVSKLTDDETFLHENLVPMLNEDYKVVIEFPTLNVSSTHQSETRQAVERWNRILSQVDKKRQMIVRPSVWKPVTKMIQRPDGITNEHVFDAYRMVQWMRKFIL